VPPKRVQSESHKKTAVGEKKCKKLAGKIIIISQQSAVGIWHVRVRSSDRLGYSG